MSTVNEMKKLASQYRKSKNFQKALPIFEDLWNSKRDACNEWDGWGYAYCLNKVKNYTQSLDICREVYREKPDFAFIKNLYAWNIYYTEINKDEPENESRFLKAASGILGLSNQEDKYSPFSQTVFKVLNYYSHKVIFNTERILEWMVKLNVDLLETTPVTFLDNTGKQRELSSPKEKYYSLMSKTLFERGSYTECIEISNEALESFRKYHHSNDIWIRRHIALSNFHLGNFDLALEQLKAILASKREWFIQKEIADVYLRLDEYDLALQYATEAALNFGDFEKKMNLFLLLADVLQRLGNQDKAKQHVELVINIRMSNNWKISSELQSLMEFYKINTAETEDNNVLKTNLKHFWQSVKIENKPSAIGKVENILPNGKSGFIRSNLGESYYFNLKDFNDDSKYFTLHQPVAFFVEDGFDKKKNKQSKIAVGIQHI